MNQRKQFVPREWQPPMIAHALDVERGGLFCPMGSGKTSAILTSLDALHMTEDHPTLVLAPLRVAKSTWPDEAKKWSHTAHLDIVPIVGSEEERRMALKYDAPIYTCNYDNIVWLVEHFGDRWPFRTVIADESTRLKSFRLRQGGKRAQALGRVAHRHIQRFINLTGTPSPNGLTDLWGQTWFLDAGHRLGRTYDAFRQRWFQKSFDGFSLTPLPHAQVEMQEKLRDIYLTIDLKDYIDLRDPVVNNIYIDLPVRARQLYRDMEKRMFAEIEGHAVEAFGAAGRTLKCLQMANGAAYVDDAGTWKEVHDAKIQALDSIIEEANGAPVLVAYHFKSDLARLSRAFPQGRPLDADPATIRAWNECRIPVLFAHPASAGHGLNLQDGGNILVFFGHDWNLENRLQIIERIGPTRQAQAGHDRPMFIHNIIARDTVDELVLERVETKREVQDILLSAMKRKRGG